jgi:hypothetical protein
MPNDYQAKITKRLEEVTGRRFCSSCQSHQEVDKGVWTPLANGLRRRWKCFNCLERQKQRAKERLQTVS